MKPLVDFCGRVFSFLLLGTLANVGLLSGTPAQPVSGGCKPVSERTTEVGCWIVAHEPVGRINEPQVFWHLDVYPTRAAAQEAKVPQGTVIETFGIVWLLTIAWKKAGARKVEKGSLKSVHSL
jgi:hypothetical protein